MWRYKNILITIYLILPVFLCAGDYGELLKKPEYKKLKDKFGRGLLIAKLQAYQYALPSDSYEHSTWNLIANKVIGTYGLDDEKRRHFLVSVMLHSEKNMQGLRTLVACYNIPVDQVGIPTPHGDIYMPIHDDQYQSAMQVSKHIRETMFGTSGGQANPLVLVDKVDYRMNVAIKWALFKVASVMVHMVSSVYKKEEKKQTPKQNDQTVSSSWAIADMLQNIEEIATQELENKYPILKTHEVKSLINEKTWWLYNRKNWIIMAGLSGMGLLLLGILYDKIPYVYQPSRMLILGNDSFNFGNNNFNNITVSGGSTFIRM